MLKKIIFFYNFIYKNFLKLNIKKIFLCKLLLSCFILLNFYKNMSYMIILYKIIFLLIIFLFSFFFLNKFSFFSFSFIFSSIWLHINISSVILLYKIQYFFNPISYFFIININNFFLFKYNIIFYFNKVNIVYILIVSIISVFANLTTINYMKYDQKKESFLFFLNMFSISMLFLVLTKNLLVILLFWEFLGITSFFLIFHYDLKAASKKSAMKAFSFNRVSDLYLIAASIIYYNIMGNFNTNQSNLKIFLQNNDYVNFFFFKMKMVSMFTWFIFVASIIKSTQIGTHLWLPDSMEAPLPASALIHSATLIAAGFYLILHFYQMYITSIFFLKTFLYLGLITSLYGSIIAFYQNDLKKILAYSTIGNCGFMLSILSLKNVDLFLIYFSLHGLFKSICFMTCGFFIDSFKHSQDNRKKNNFFFNKYYFFIIISLILTLGGLPITFVFFIKHLFFIKFSSNFILLNFLLKMYSIFSVLYALNFIHNTVFNYNFYKNKFKYNSNYIFIFYYFFYIVFLYLLIINNKFFSKINFFNKNLFLENIIYIDFFIFLFFIKFFKNLEFFNKQILLITYLTLIASYYIKIFI